VFHVYVQYYIGIIFGSVIVFVSLIIVPYLAWTNNFYAISVADKIIYSIKYKYNYL